MKNFLSPLRYPGGKTRAVDQISALIPKDTKEIIAPFFGGGSVEIHCAKQGIKVKGYDIFKSLVEFWECIFEDRYKLAKLIEEYHPLTKERFYELQKNQSTYEPKFRRAAVFFVLNRSSFSGSTLSGGMSPNHPRFNQSAIERVKEFSVSGITVENVDFSESIPANSGKFFYLDPPYLIKSNLYGNKGDTHKDFQHEKLFNIIKNEENWILSYNSCKEIEDMYKDFNFIYPNWKYGMSKEKDSKEIIILSYNVFEKLKKEGVI